MIIIQNNNGDNNNIDNNNLEQFLYDRVGLPNYIQIQNKTEETSLIIQKEEGN